MEGQIMSTEEWATKAARQIMTEGDRLRLALGGGLVESEVASIISAHVAPLAALLQEARREHHGVDDEGDPCEKVNYLDGLHVCTCGADAWNARVDAVLAGSETQTCINCRATLGNTAYGFGPSTPPGAKRREVGPFCEACNKLIYVHIGPNPRNP
jgi:hypothetical protein